MGPQLSWPCPIPRSPGVAVDGLNGRSDNWGGNSLNRRYRGSHRCLLVCLAVPTQASDWSNVPCLLIRTGRLLNRLDWLTANLPPFWRKNEFDRTEPSPPLASAD